MRSPAGPLSLSLLIAAVAAAGPIAIPNFSFEDPTVRRGSDNPFGALPNIADWDEKNVGVGVLDEADVDTGVFVNTEPSEPDHIANMHLNQAAFVSSLLGNAIRQELPQTFVVGRRYTFTVAVATSYTFPVGQPEQLEVALFYFVGNVEHIVASSFVSGAEVGPTELVDVSVTSATVSQGDAWAGHKMGILVRPFITDPSEDDDEGFWDVDYARLVESLPPDPDGDGDGDVDLIDFAGFLNCFSETQEVSEGCSTFDLNSDLVVDLDDLWLFEEEFAGPVVE